MTTKPFRAGFIALIGEPNAGKSTLMNVLLQEKVSIVSPKPQTTRQRITGILTTDRAQAVFVDAPGVIKSTSGINPFLRDEAKDVIVKSDAALLLLPADGGEDMATELVEMLKHLMASGKVRVLVTKSDLLTGTRTPKFFKYLLDQKIQFTSISAKMAPDEARSEVMNFVEDLLPESAQPLFDPELFTTQSVRDMVGEIIRERCFENLHQEIPYGLAILLLHFKENEGPVVKIAAEVVVDRDNHKGIVIGAKGANLKKIGSEARAQIEKLIGQKVFLELHVRVKEGWTKNKQMMKELGYVIRDE
jgi:GTP-binding protein Era